MSFHYVVVYPSAARGETAPLRLTGRLVRVLDLPDPAPAIQQPDGTLVLLDPRALVLDVVTQRCVYSPRTVPADELPPWVRDWLREHPRWGVPGCEQDWLDAVRGEAR